MDYWVDYASRWRGESIVSVQVPLFHVNPEAIMR